MEPDVAEPGAGLKGLGVEKGLLEFCAKGLGTVLVDLPDCAKGLAKVDGVLLACANGLLEPFVEGCGTSLVLEKEFAKGELFVGAKGLGLAKTLRRAVAVSVESVMISHNLRVA